MSQDPDIAVIRRVLEGFEAAFRENRVGDDFHPEGVEIVPLRADLEGTLYRGPDAPRQFLDGVRESWESLAFEPLEVRRVGENILALVRLNARSREAGVDIELTVGAVCRLRDGKIVYVHTYMDPAEAIAAAEG